MGRACEGTSQNGSSTDQGRQRLGRGDQDATYTPNTSQPDRVNPAHPARRPGLHSVGGGRSRLAQCVAEGFFLIERLVAVTDHQRPTARRSAVLQIAATAQAGNDV